MEKIKATKKQDNTLSVKSVSVANQIASFLVPDYNEGQSLAIVDESVLKVLKSFLPKADFFTIKDNFLEELGYCFNLEALVKCAKDMVAFHETVNLLKTYFDPKVVVTKEKPFNVEEELTFDEMKLRYESMITEMDMLQTMIKDHPDNPAKDQIEVVANH